jgi:Ca2+-binding RTX toxin-like protein
VDTIISKLSSFTLIYSTMDNLVLGAGALNGTGNWIANVLTGNEQNNILHGGDGNDTIHGLGGNDQLWGDGGADAMYGGQGDDSYYVDNIGDSLIELAGEGIDRVSSSVNHTLGFDLEHLTLTGSAVIGIGNELDNQLTGNNANNQLQGNGGQDVLDGKAGDLFTALGSTVDTGELRISPWSAKALDANDFLLFVPGAGSL